ncbi:MAG: dihydroorotate dehydrogenase-like protein [Lentisphaerae bacterium]|jgi:dihydroorotate dehydrogenase (fumarate)|nr:dihydroorotate dehydrogenase-like protein [Lentisphaerota bacterium]MBT4819050.1 dihydroorotate dehydrogenase-like protein [Lentisphaerota bacterium]MBT5612314.1 dihydroorotate dehydrogenase-like protein [Lentisphaerota bacterium]MBT7060708.1 dihydroorotate dehydrogenase-like protein [Lentisphaerota bacterium]MBT7845293.1 dihydroorotate dehydrogenase-like protein [Lentisphaerota bacterium]
MADLATTYLGLELRNPLVIGACSLTMDAKGVKKCADAGAGAVVLKSLFEEQIRMNSSGLDNSLAAEEQWHSEVFEYMEADIGMQYGTREYLAVVSSCKESVDIPVIASINCVSAEWWQEYATEVAAAGADALELNIAIMPETLTVTSEEIEERYVQIVQTAREAVDIPIAVKLGPYITSVPQLILRLRQAGGNGSVLFNRFYRPTIDPNKLCVTVDNPYSSPAELSVALRWISLLSGKIATDFSAATGIHTGLDVARALLAGARTAQICSALYMHGLPQIGRVLDELEQWMETSGFATVADARGKLSQHKNPGSELFGRCQYIKGLVGLE